MDDTEDTTTPESGNEVGQWIAEESAAEASPETTPAAEAAPPAWDPKPWEFDWNGKRIVPESAERVKGWASQGYNYSQRMGEFNKQKLQYETEYAAKQKAIQEQEQRFSPFMKVDEYAKANPQWWQHTLQAYEQAQRQAQVIDPNLSTVLKPLEEKIGKFEKYFGDIEQQREQEKVKQFDDALDQEIQATRGSFPNFAWDQPDAASGKTVEARVLEHARAIGTGSFKTAFRDLFYDQLMEQAKASGKEAIAKTAEQNARKGILGKSPTPVRTPDAKPAPRGKWNSPQFEAEALIKSMGF